MHLTAMAPIPRPTGVGPSVATPKPLARISAADHSAAALRFQRSLTLDPEQPCSPGARGRVIARAAPSEAVAAIDAVVKQQATHDSLLKNSTASAWEMLDQVLFPQYLLPTPPHIAHSPDFLLASYFVPAQPRTSARHTPTPLSSTPDILLPDKHTKQQFNMHLMVSRRERGALYL